MNKKTIITALLALVTTTSVLAQNLIKTESGTFCLIQVHRLDYGKDRKMFV